MPRIRSGSKVIPFEKILALNLEKRAALYDLLLKLICKGVNMLFILEPVVARVKIHDIHRSLFMVLNYGSIVFSDEYFPEELLELNPVEVLDPFWAKILQPKCVGLDICGNIDIIPSNSLSAFKGNTDLHICIGDCCTILLNELNLDYKPVHIEGKLKVLDKNHFITYELKEILGEVQSSVSVLAYIVKGYSRAPLKPLLSIDNEPALFDLVVKPYILLPIELYNPDKVFELILRIILARSIFYLSSKYTGFLSP